MAAKKVLELIEHHRAVVERNKAQQPVLIPAVTEAQPTLRVAPQVESVHGDIMPPNYINVWDRQSYDTDISWAAFVVYRDMHPAERDLLKAYNVFAKRKLESVPFFLKRWFKQYQWRERTMQYDIAQDRQVQVLWSKRRRDQREKEWELSTRLIAKAEAMLQFPLTRVSKEETLANGKTKITIIEPAGWRLADIPRMLGVASKLARLAAGMETEILNTNPETIDEQIARELQRLAPGSENQTSGAIETEDEGTGTDEGFA